MRILKAAAATAAALVLCGAGCADMESFGAPPPVPVTAQFHISSATRAIAVTKVQNHVAMDTLIGKYGDGCMQESVPVYARNAFSQLRSADLADNFDTEARIAGYRLAERSAGELFESSDAKTAELWVGAIILNIEVRGCLHGILNNHDGAVRGAVTVEWQVYDPLEKKILFKSTNTGEARVSAPVNLITVQVLRAAFQNSAKMVLASPEFEAVVRDPKGGTAASNDSLFAEADTAKPAAGPTQIPRLSLSTTPFKDRVPVLQRHVVTVVTAGGTGSAFYITNGLLLTNEHVIRGASRFKIRFFGGREIYGEVVKSDAKRDIALLKTESVGLPGLPLRLDNPDLTARVFVIGSPLGEKNEGSITSGIISAYRKEKGKTFIQSDAAVTHGNSGGPILDEFGNVVGLADLTSYDPMSGSQTAVNLFIPIADGLQALDITFAPKATASAASKDTTRNLKQ